MLAGEGERSRKKRSRKKKNQMARIVVCKVGGSIVDGIHPTFVDDLKRLRSQGVKVVLVHGGADQVTEIAEKLGKKQRFIKSPEGITSRYTDKETAEIFTMVMSGLVAKRFVQDLGKNGIDAVSLSGIDARTLLADRKSKLLIVDDRGRKLAIDGGYTGKITSVNTGFVNLILESSMIPVVSPIALGREWELLNVDGDRACSHIAGAMAAEFAVFLTDVEGVILNNEVVRELSVEEARKTLKLVGAGMDKKLLAAAEAVEMGARSAVISSGLVNNPLQNALAGRGTLIKRSA